MGRLLAVLFDQAMTSVLSHPLARPLIGQGKLRLDGAWSLLWAAGAGFLAALLYPTLHLWFQVDSEIKNLATIQARLHALHGNPKSDPLVIDAVKKHGIFPTSMRASGAPTHAWGGRVVVEPAAFIYSPGAHPVTYRIRYEAVPAEACANLIIQSAHYVEAIAVGGHSGEPLVRVGTPEHNRTNQSRLDTPRAVEQCLSRTSSDITLSFT